MTGWIRQNVRFSPVTFRAAEPPKRWPHRRVRSDLFGRVMVEQVFFLTGACFARRTRASLSKVTFAQAYVAPLNSDRIPEAEIDRQNDEAK